MEHKFYVIIMKLNCNKGVHKNTTILNRILSLNQKKIRYASKHNEVNSGNSRLKLEIPFSFNVF